MDNLHNYNIVRREIYNKPDYFVLIKISTEKWYLRIAERESLK